MSGVLGLVFQEIALVSECKGRSSLHGDARSVSALPPEAPAAARGYAPLWVGLGVLALAVLFINPFREMAVEDDWAYARTVRHLNETGQFHLDPWLSANMPFQAYWGELFAKVFGYSHTSLRLATLALAFLGLAGFFFLAREHDLGAPQAGLLMLGLIASPIVLYFSFNFMTDVPYLMGLILATLLYTRAIRLHSYGLMLVASVAAAATILTRQFGVALIAAALAQWVSGKDRWRQLPFFAGGLVLPVAVAVWQFYEGFASPSWAATLNKHGQLQYLTSGTVVLDAPWRLALILEYSALFALPLVLAAVVCLAFDYPRPARKWVLAVLLLAGAAAAVMAARDGWRAYRAGADSVLGESFLVLGGLAVVGAAGWLLVHPKELGRDPARPGAGGKAWVRVLLPVFLAVLFGAGALYGRKVGIQHLMRFMGSTAFPAEPSRFDFWLMPYIPWVLYGWRFMGVAGRFLLTGVVVVGGILLARVLGSRGLRYRAGAVPPGQRFLDLTTLFLLAEALVYHHIGDEYLIVFLPLVLILVGRSLKDWLSYRSLRVVLTAVCLLLVAVSALWVRGKLAGAEARWQAAEAARARGADVKQIHGDCWEWRCYHGAFDDYLAQLGGRTPETFDDFFRWWDEQGRRAVFVVQGAEGPGDLEAVFEVSYRDELWRERHVYVFKVQPADAERPN